MEDKIFLLVRCIVDTKHPNIHDAIAEFQEETQIQVKDTPKVKVMEVQIIKMNTKTERADL